MHILQARKPNTNVGELERWLSLVGGSSLVAFGLARRNSSGFGLAALGGSLLWRGATGHCPMYQTLGVNTSERGYAKGTGSRAGVPYELGIRVDQELRINKPVSEVYAFWRDLSNLPRFMDHLECVKVINDRLSHWEAKGPAGMSVGWDAEIINDVPGKIIGWRSLEGSDVDNGGSVRFEPTNNGAERALRPAVLWRKGSFGSDAAAGSRFVERMMTVAATCRQQGRRLLDFLVEAGQAALNGTPAPSLLPALKR